MANYADIAGCLYCANRDGGDAMSKKSDNVFRWGGARAEKARASRLYESWFVRALLVLLTIALIALGVYLLLVTHSAMGWLEFGAAIVLIMMLIFAKMELLHLPVGKGNSLDDILSRNVLKQLKHNPTNKDIAKLVPNTASGRFLAARYAITPNMLNSIVEDLDSNPEETFAKAREIMEKTGSSEIEGGTLGVALIAIHPNCESILKSMKLELDDLCEGITWFNYLHGLVKNYNRPRHTGGFARDLSFGYTPYLTGFGQNLSRTREGKVREQVKLAQHEEIVQRMIETFSKGGRQNVALVGPSGSGRSTIVTAFADALLNSDNKISRDLQYRQIFKLDAGSLISKAGGQRGGIEGLVTNILGEAFAAKNIIIWLDNAHLFFEEGVGSVDIANVLQPIIEAGRLRMILTMEQQKFLEISARNASLTNDLNVIMVEPASKEETMKIMQDHVPILEYQHNVIYTHWALTEAYRLSERYIHDLVMPGRALNLLESAAGYTIEDKFVTDESVQKAIEKTYGVKMQASQDEGEKLKLLNLEELIHQRMIGQEMAVKAVSDALRRSAAGVRNQNRPIGTFLFIGPTGVGKTELAKAISDVYFKGEGEIIRLDLNEYVEASDVSRLIADGTEDEMSLTAQVMKHPFSVVLLDEIEKAHPQVLTTLLQMLDEGILRDSKNHEVSFRDAIVIATSNAGAEKIRHYIDSGTDLANVKEEITNELIRNGEFKPEFLNRFDEVCIFKPLTKENLTQIVDLIIAGVNKTLEPQKISVKLENDAKELLVERGYDPKMGARPMRRIVQNTVENIVAKAVLAGIASNGSEIPIDAEMIQMQLDK